MYILVSVNPVKKLKVVVYSIWGALSELLKPFLQSLSILVESNPPVNQGSFTVVFLFHRTQSFTKRSVGSERRLVLDVVNLLINMVESPT